MSRRTFDFGIDLGTTNSEIAILEKGEVRVFKNNKREEYTPSVVRIDDKGTIFVGRKAYERLVDDEPNTVAEFKRWMGTQECKEFKAAREIMSPEELSAEVLKDLKATAKASLHSDEEIDAAVITVPCNFKNVQCEATQRAARLAGIKHLILLQEPIAASIAYGFLEKMPRGYWVVFDLGGGTFDVAIMAAKEGRLSVVDHCGDNHLGGKDFDWEIVQQIIYPALLKEYDLPGLGRSFEYRTLNAVLKHAAEEVKIELSAAESADIIIHSVRETLKDKNGRAIDISIPIKRDQLNALIEDDVEKSILLFKKALLNQSLSPSDISQLILVGGPTQIPYLRTRLKDEFHIPTDHRIDPLTVVAQGAAVYAAAQLLPEQSGPRDQTKAHIDIKYSAMTTETETWVGGKIQLATENEAGIKNLRIQISSLDGGWQSGMIEVQDKTFSTKITLRERKVNVFQITLQDDKGNKIPVESDTFSINQGISVAEPPLISSIGVEVSDGSFDIHLPRGISLPARSKPIKYHTTREVRPNEKEDILNIHVLEGESRTASHNMHLGTLKINGDAVKRTLPKGSEIEIIINVDKSMSVTAEAFLPLLQDQKFKDVLQGKASPKLDPEHILISLREEEERLRKIQTEIRNAGDASLNAKFEEAGVDQRIKEIKNEVEAAKGGDPDSAEKADHRLKELGEVLDPIEYLTRWPSVASKFSQIYDDGKGVIDSYGVEDDKDQLAALRKEADRAMEIKDGKRLEKITGEIMSLRWSVLFKQPGFWISAFQEIKKNPPTAFTNKARAEELIEEGSIALQRQDLDALKSIMFELWGLIPSEDQESISERVSDSGIRKI